MRDQLVLRVVAKWLIPPILVFGCYIITHGEIGPGGGFQGGVVLASAFILYGLIYGREALHQAVPRGVWEFLASFGALAFSGIGLYSLVRGGKFLDYTYLMPSHPAHGEPWGMSLVEYGVGFTVCSVMVIIYDMVCEPQGDQDAQDEVLR